MLVYLIRRIGQSLLVVAVMATLVFLAIYAVGDPVAILANPEADQRELDAIAARLGLDRPIYEQFGIFVWNALQGDLGRSFVYAEPATKVILQRLPATLELAFVGLMFSILIGIPLGVIAGLKPDSFFGRSIMSTSILGFSLPNFWVGLMLILIFAVQLRWLPASGRGETVEVLGVPLAMFTANGWAHLILPAITLALYKAALVIRIAQAGTRDVILQDYIRFARAKGLSYRRIVGVHVLKNMMIPVVTVLGLELGSMIAFAVVTETVFAYPGMGKLLIDSINRLDRPVIVAYLMMTVIIFVVINLVVDLLYAAIDPRVRLSEAKG
jgi:peptide/nickel transport system permease protein